MDKMILYKKITLIIKQIDKNPSPYKKACTEFKKKIREFLDCSFVLLPKEN